MGWTSCYKWSTPTILRCEYVEDITRSGKIQSLGWCGSFLKCIHVPTGRPFVIDVMVRKFGKREYGYKDVEGSSGPGGVNLAAARWLRRELEDDPMVYSWWRLGCSALLRKIVQHRCAYEDAEPCTDDPNQGCGC